MRRAILTGAYYPVPGLPNLYLYLYLYLPVRNAAINCFARSSVLGLQRKLSRRRYFVRFFRNRFVFAADPLKRQGRARGRVYEFPRAKRHITYRVEITRVHKFNTRVFPHAYVTSYATKNSFRFGFSPE